MLSRFVRQLLQSAGLPLTPRQFWWFSFLYWGFFAVVWYGQAAMVWYLTPDSRLYYSETLYWFFELLFWWGATPLVIYCAQRFPLMGNEGTFRMIGKVLLHVLIAAILYGLELLVEHLLLGSVRAHEQGQAVTLHRVATVFFLSYGTALGQYMLLVALYSIFTYVYRFRSLKEQHLQTELTNEQLQNQLANAQLQSLKMQLNPHFLFNTLHTVVSLMIRGQTRRATLMVTSLSDLLRGVLARQQANFLSLREEMTLTRQYLSIQQIRFEDRLTVEFQVDSETENCPVPQLILQPLVENAITHGIADMTGGALVRVSAQHWADHVVIEVFDNGVGCDKLSETSGTGLGLANTLSRLEKAYGDKAQLRLEQPPGGTTTVRLLIPCQCNLSTSIPPAP